MSSDDRQQGEAFLVTLIAIILWISHQVAARWTDLPGNLDLQPWIKIWNKPILLNWPCGLIPSGFLLGYLIFARRSHQNADSNRRRRTSRHHGKMR